MSISHNNQFLPKINKSFNSLHRFSFLRSIMGLIQSTKSPIRDITRIHPIQVNFLFLCFCDLAGDEYNLRLSLSHLHGSRYIDRLCREALGIEFRMGIDLHMSCEVSGLIVFFGNCQNRTLGFNSISQRHNFFLFGSHEKN